MSLGSIFGNDHFDGAVARLSEWSYVMRPQDRMLLGMDANTNAKEIWNSYHDSQGLFESFIRNGLAYSNKVLGHSWYKADDWEITGILQDDPVMHRFVIRAVRDVICKPLRLKFVAGD